jgi:tetratricopeptide (TPR) repeat protein
MPTRRLFMFVLCAALCSQGAQAAIPPRAQEAYDDGRFIMAATLSEAEGSADALAFAARARIADAVTRDDGACGECLLRAEQTAEAAIKRDANLADAYVQLAVAMGFRGRLVGVAEARSQNMAEKGRAAIDKALELDPNNLWARASSGGWHLEIVHRAGAILAAIVYGAHEDEGLKLFRDALAADPTNLVVHYQFALSVLALDVKRFRAEAAKALADGDSDPRKDALTRLMRERADKLRELLKTETDEDVAAFVRRFQGYPPEAQN